METSKPKAVMGVVTPSSKLINDLRKVMGTLPNQSPNKQTMFYRGVEGIEVDLIAHTDNPYKAMYIFATSCWGSKINKWEETTPEGRFEIVKSVLKRETLPLALETSSFTFVIEGPSRAAFDQMARTRIGATFSAKGMRDNNWKDASFRIPEAIWADPVKKEQAMKSMLLAKDAYSEIVDSGKGSWQVARCVLPLYVCYGWSAHYTLATLMGVCAQRMKFCEMEDTVATAWLMRDAVAEKFPLIGQYLVPGCDNGARCQYHATYKSSELFGCLFKECGRNRCEATNEYAEFNESCTDVGTLRRQLPIEIFNTGCQRKFETFESLTPSDKKLFLDK